MVGKPYKEIGKYPGFSKNALKSKNKSKMEVFLDFKGCLGIWAKVYKGELPL